MDQPKPQKLELIDHVRATKSQLELLYIKQGADILSEVFKRLRNWIEPGLTEQQVGLFLEEEMASLGVRQVAFTPIVASGKNAANIHHWPGTKEIQEGDLVMIDFGAVIKGYCSDMTRTLFMGKPTQKQISTYNAVLKAQTVALGKIKPGVTGDDLDKAARSVLKRAKLNAKFTHNLGHGVGQYIHEWPRLGEDSTDVLEQGMVVTVEPGVYIKDWGGIRIEDMVRVHSKGGEILTRAPKDIDSMIVDLRFK